jgi:anti-sigma factor RsiW
VELIAAYIDGDLDLAAEQDLEKHLDDCPTCTEELRLQKMFVRELDSAFLENDELPVPRDFARVVAANAESDMRGARSSQEHRLALRFCAILGLASFALLGVASSEAVIQSGKLVANNIFGLLGVLAKALYDAGVGMTVIIRVAAGAVVSDAFSVLVFLVFLLALLLLLLLISSYHRYHRRGLYE